MLRVYFVVSLLKYNYNSDFTKKSQLWLDTQIRCRLWQPCILWVVQQATLVIAFTRMCQCTHTRTHTHVCVYSYMRVHIFFASLMLWAMLVAVWGCSCYLYTDTTSEVCVYTCIMCYMTVTCCTASVIAYSIARNACIEL